MTMPYSTLPIDGIRDTLCQAARAVERRILLTAPTGSGKSTRVPGFLADDGAVGPGRIVCLQPRRLAARMLARRVAAERHSQMGAEVGYRVRFDQRAGARTRIIYETDGILLREMLDHPDLPDVAAIIFDEFHERHLFGDVLMGLALKLQRRRSELLLVAMSATLETEGGLRRLLNPCRTVAAEGRCFPVEIRHLPPRRLPRQLPLWEAASSAFGQHATSLGTGHTLVFMPGAYEIRRTLEEFSRLPAARGRRLLPLYGELPAVAQDAAAAPGHAPAIIVATNIAETSLTIEGVTAVIDSGLARQAGYDPARGVNSLLIEPISRASADQRAGRAGRTAPGICLRLWSENDHAKRLAHTPPESARLDLSEIVLRLHALGIVEPADFPWVDPPEADRLAAATDLLRNLGALDARTGAVTPMGRRMLNYPLHPRWARLLTAAVDNGCVDDVALAAALSQERDILLNTTERAIREHRRQAVDTGYESDILQRIGLWRHVAAQHFDRTVCEQLGLHEGVARRVGELAAQFRDIARHCEPQTDLPAASADRVSACLLAAFPDRVARRLTPGASRIQLTAQRRGVLERDSAVRNAPLMVAPEISQVEIRRGEIETRIRLASAITLEQLQEVHPDRLRRERQTAYDPERRRVTVAENLMFMDLLVATQATGLKPTTDEAAACLAEEISAGRMTLKEWTPAIDQWIYRLNNLAAWCPELALPIIGPAEQRYLTEQICHGAASAADVRQRPVRATVQAWLSEAQRALLDRHAPERITLSNGKNVKLVYESDTRAPMFSARLQELYDVAVCPSIAMGRVRVRACILAPNQRPAQITDDLASFWSDGYPRVKKELRGRYPKHEWR